MKSRYQKEKDSSKKALTVGAINLLKAEVGQRDAHTAERMCGTYLLRQGLEAMTERDRDELLTSMQLAGLLPEI